MVDDFLAMGLDVDYPEDATAEGYLALRKAREEWYLGALVSGLRLTKEQEGQARERMGALRERDYAEFVGYLDGVKSFEHEGQEMKVFDGGKARRLMDAGGWMKSESYQPWELCELTEEQLVLTNFGNKSMDEVVAKKFKDWPTSAEDVYGFGEQSNVPEELKKDFGTLYALGLLHGWGEVESTFPYSQYQAKMLMGGGDGLNRSPDLNAAIVLQPEQLMVYLLLNPGATGSLLVALDEAEKPSE